MELRHYNTWFITRPAFLTVVSLFGSWEWTLYFPGVEGKERQHFLSQYNLSLCLTRLPAIFTKPKLQMIYFQLHYSPALQHMVLSITLVTTEQNLQRSKTLNLTEWATEKIGKKENKRRKRGALWGLIHISFAGCLLLLEGEEIHTRVNGITGLSLVRQLGHCEASEQQQNTAHPQHFQPKYCCVSVLETQLERYLMLLQKQNKLISLRGTTFHSLPFVSHLGTAVTLERVGAQEIWA